MSRTHAFNVGHAAIYGIEEALLIQSLAWWLEKNRAEERNVDEGRTWTYNTYEQIAEGFPYLSKEKVRRAILSLVEQGVLLKRHGDRCVWLAFADEAAFLCPPPPDKPKGGSSKVNAEIGRANSDFATCNKVSTVPDQLLTKNPPIPPARGNELDLGLPPPEPQAKPFDEALWKRFWQVYPPREGDRTHKAARAKFIALVQKGADPEKIIAGAKRYRAFMDAKVGYDEQKRQKGTGGPFVARAISWLNGEAWENPWEVTFAPGEFASQAVTVEQAREIARRSMAATGLPIRQRPSMEARG